MEFIAQRLEDIVASLRPLAVEWKDDTARRVIDRLQAFPIKPIYTVDDLRGLLDGNFDDGVLICRLFLGLSKDQFITILREARGDEGIGVKAYREDANAFLESLLGMGILEAMMAEANREAHWSDVLVERLRSGRGSAIAGQKRGRGVEDFAESIVRKVFGEDFSCAAHSAVHADNSPSVTWRFLRRKRRAS